MKWPVMVALTGSDGTVWLHEVSAGGTNPIECSAGTVGLTMADRKRTRAGVQDHLVRAPSAGKCSGPSAAPTCSYRSGHARSTPRSGHCSNDGTPALVTTPPLLPPFRPRLRDTPRDPDASLVVTHAMQFARAVGTRALFMDIGRFLHDGPPTGFFTNPRHAREQCSSCVASMRCLMRNREIRRSLDEEGTSTAYPIPACH